MTRASGPLYFAQISDAHVGPQGLNPLEAAANLTWALAEIAALPAPIGAIIATADLVSAGNRRELETWANTASESRVPIRALPANHDLWGEKDDAAWRALIGPLRQRVDLGPLVVLLWDDTVRVEDNSWPARLTGESAEWLAAELAACDGRAVIVAHHVPILPIGDSYHDKWSGSNAAAAVRLFTDHGVLATITGHWHRTGEWSANGLQVINTGALAGWQWNGIPPHYCFPTRPGYRLFCYVNGELKTIWREGSFWQTPPPGTQVTLEWVGPAHTGGPRPQVRAPLVLGKVRLLAKALALAGPVERVEFSLRRGDWRPMQRVFDGLWSEWEAEMDPGELRPGGPYPIAVCAAAGAGTSFDAVPVSTTERDSAPAGSAPALPGPDHLWELFYPPG